MTFKLTNKDHRQLDKFLNRFFKAYKKGDISLSQARATLAHVMTAGVIDNESEFKKWLDAKPKDIFE